MDKHLANIVLLRIKFVYIIFIALFLNYCDHNFVNYLMNPYSQLVSKFFKYLELEICVFLLGIIYEAGPGGKTIFVSLSCWYVRLMNKIKIRKNYLDIPKVTLKILNLMACWMGRWVFTKTPCLRGGVLGWSVAGNSKGDCRPLGNCWPLLRLVSELWFSGLWEDLLCTKNHEKLP